MKNIIMFTLLCLATSFSSAAFARDCIVGFQKVEMGADQMNEGENMYACIKSYPAHLNTICPPLFSITKSGNTGFSCEVKGIARRYMCKTPDGGKIAGHEFMFKIGDLPLTRFTVNDRGYWQREERRTANTSSHKIVAYVCN